MVFFLVQSASAIESQNAIKSNKSNFTWGYGLKTALVFIPYPFIEGGLESSNYAIRASLGSAILWGKGSLELVRKKFIKQNYDLFLSGGYEYFFMSYTAKTYSFGLDVHGILGKFNGENLYLRIECGFYDDYIAHNKPEAKNETNYRFMPSFGIGVRF